MIWKTVSVRTLVPIISALIAVRDPICTWQDMAWHGGTPLVHNGPHWSTWQDTAGPTTRKSSSAVSALIGLSLKEEVISLGGNNNLLFTMYNVPNKYIQSARYEFRTTLSACLKERSLDGRTHDGLLRARVFLTHQHYNRPTAAAAWWQPLVKSAKKYKRCDHHKSWEAGNIFGKVGQSSNCTVEQLEIKRFKLLLRVAMLQYLGR